MLNTTLYYKKKTKQKKFNLTKQMKQRSVLFSWLGLKSKRKKRKAGFFYFLDIFRKTLSKKRRGKKNRKLLKSRLKFIRFTKALKKRSRRKRHWPTKNKRYKYNSFTILKNYSRSNFKKDYKNGLAYQRYRRKRRVKRLKYWMLKKS